MKKVASLVLCVALLLTLAACGIPEGMEEQAQLYQKYAELIDALERKEYWNAMHQVAQMDYREQLANQGDRPEAVQLMERDWTLYRESEYNVETPTQVRFAADGTCTINGADMTWTAQGSGDDYVEGIVLGGGENKYWFRFSANRKSPSLSTLTLSLAVNVEWGVTNGDRIGTYIAHAKAPAVMGSWYLLDGTQNADSSVYLDGYSFSYGELSYTWDITSGEEDDTVVIKASAQNGYTDTCSMVMQERDGHYVLTVTNDTTGDTGLYYTEAYGYEKTWPEYLYPGVMRLMKDYLRNNYFYADGSYEGNAARKYLYEQLTVLGDYKDSAEYLTRFSILPSMLTNVYSYTTDQLGNENRNTLAYYAYDEQGRRITARGEEIAELTGLYDTGSNMNLEYDASGKISKITQGWGNTVNCLATPTYDADGRWLSTDVQTSSRSYTSVFTYDDQGRVASLTVPQEYYTDPRTITYTYNDAGQLAQKVHSYNDGRYVLTTDYTYENGLLVREEISYWFRYGEAYTSTYAYSYDSDGHITGVEVTTTNPDNTAKAMRREYVYEDLYFFDDTGLTEAE